MDKKPRKKASDESMLKSKSSEEIQLNLFLMKCVREKKIRPEQTHELTVFFSDLGLKQKEDPELYEQALKKY